jgi:ATP-binding cassette, subfamily B, bacterial
MNENRAMKTSYLIRRFAPYFKQYRWVLALDLFCAALTTVCELVLPLIVRYITDMGMNNLQGLDSQNNTYNWCSFI